MTTEVHQVVGGEIMVEICKRHNLTVEDRKSIDDILEKWENSVGKMDEKVRTAVDIIKDNPRRGDILDALLETTVLYWKKKAEARSEKK